MQPSGVACKISYTLDGDNQIIILDTIDEDTVTTQSTITTHPIVTGDILADHMYKEPASMNISGEFSLNGGSATVIKSGGSKLANMQTLFERIKNEGILCNIVKISMTANGESVRFLSRPNMALTRIVWTERINSLKFSFGFTQVFLSKIQIIKPTQSDENLPAITEASTANFTDLLLDWNVVDTLMLDLCVGNGMMTEDFKEMALEYGVNYYGGIGIGAVAGVGATVAAGSAIGTAALSSLGIAASAATIGLTVFGAVAVAIIAVGLALAIKAVVDNVNYRKAQFKLYADDKQNAAEVERYNNWQSEVHKQLLQFDRYIHCWRIATDEEQECLLNINNTNYIFTFTCNNANTEIDEESQKKIYSYTLKVTDDSNKDVAYKTDISSSPTDFASCAKNYLFRAAESGNYVYLIRLPFHDQNNILLTDYVIVSSEINAEDYTSKLIAIVQNALEN